MTTSEALDQIEAYIEASKDETDKMLRRGALDTTYEPYYPRNFKKEFDRNRNRNLSSGLLMNGYKPGSKKPNPTAYWADTRDSETAHRLMMKDNKEKAKKTSGYTSLEKRLIKDDYKRSQLHKDIRKGELERAQLKKAIKTLTPEERKSLKTAELKSHNPGKSGQQNKLKADIIKRRLIKGAPYLNEKEKKKVLTKDELRSDSSMLGNTAMKLLGI